MRKVAVVGIGSPLAGDDGLGLEVIRLLRPHWGDHPEVLLIELEGDLMAVADLLPQAQRFLFVDAVAGDSPGDIVVTGEARRAFAPSLHQTDISAVMSSLAAIDMVTPFPPWQVWGIVIDPPRELRPGLTPTIERAVHTLIPRLNTHLHVLLSGLAGSDCEVAGGVE